MAAIKKYYTPIFTYILILLFGWLSTLSYIAPKKEVEFKITPEFDNYMELQKLWLKAEITNNSDIDYKLSMPFSVYKGIMFDIEDEKGKKYRDHIVELIKSGGIYDTLKSAETKEASGDLGVYFGILDLPVGKFKITAYYQNLRSNTIILDVKAPQGEEKQVRDGYVENMWNKFNFTLDRSNHDPGQYNRNLRVLMEKYPDSKYIPEIYQFMIMNLVNKPIEYVENECVFKFLDKYCHYYSARIILALYNAYLKQLDPNQVNEKLNYIRDGYPGTFTSEFAQELINANARNRISHR